MPLSGLIIDRNRVLDTDVRGENLIHRIGSVGNAETSLTTRLLLRYDAFDDDDVSDTELFRQSRESLLFYRMLTDYRKLHPHAEDGLSIAVYQNEDIQPIIAAVDAYLKEICKNRPEAMKEYAMAVTIFTESSDDSSVSRWVAQWKERWEAAETQNSLTHYRHTHLSVAHRIVSPENHYRQFVRLVSNGLEVDIAFLHGFIRAGSQGNDFELVEPYDVTTRTLKFPILEKPFCALRDPGQRLQRARVLSNRQFRLTTYHAELMARLRSRETPQNTHHVVLGFGDYTPWQGVVDALHQRAEWVVCIDPNIDERLIAEKGRDTQETREIIGFGSGVGSHGEDNFTISTEQFRLADVLHKLEASIREVYSGWTPEIYQTVAQGVLVESRHLSGLSLVRATGVGQYVRDFMAYSLTRKLLRATGSVLCDQIVSLDAYQHWFDSAESGTRPDLLWIIACIGGDGRLRLDIRLIECKLAKMSDAYLDKAREQLESGIRHLSSVFMPRVQGGSLEDERPDQRYWWLQLHRLIASKAEIKQQDQKRVLTGLERLSEGEFDIEWRAAAITFWTDQNAAEIALSDVWPYSVAGKELGIGVFSAGSEFVRLLCERGKVVDMPWDFKHIAFQAMEASPFNMCSDLAKLLPHLRVLPSLAWR
jgi:DNA phosphorothioation-dependent restriction protein DptH